MIPETAAATIVEALQQQADTEAALAAQRYFKEPVSMLGIGAPALRRLAKEWIRQLKPVWGVVEATKLADSLIRQSEYEAKAIGILILAGFARQFEPELLVAAKGWMEDGTCDNWAIIDTLAPAVLSPLIDHFPALIPEVVSWAGSSNLWLRRAAVVSFIPHARRGRTLDPAYEVVERLLGDREDLIHKATGWLLREAGKADRERLERFLLAHGPAMARTTVRYAIERFPEERRKQILVATRRSEG